MSELQPLDRKRKRRLPDTGKGNELHNATALKPQPPDDLWDQLDAAIAEVAPARPKESFTTKELAAREHINIKSAERLIRRLLDAGRLCKHGGGNKTYYVLVKP